MELLDYIQFAWRNIKNNSLRTWLTMIGIFIGIATIVSLISLGQGMQDAVTERFATLGSDKIMFQNQQAFTGPPGTLTVRTLNNHDQNLMEGVKGFDLVFGRLIKQEQIEFRNTKKFATILSMPSTQVKLDLATDALGLIPDQGRLLKASDNNKVVLGYDFGNKKIFERTLRAGDKITMHGHVFEVAGITKRLGSGFGENFVLMPEDTMRAILDIEDEWSILVGQVKAGVDPILVGAELRKVVARDRDLDEWEEDFVIQTPQELLDSFGNILAVIQAVLVGIAGISLIVGGIGIMNTMYTSVLERTKEIGIIKSIGARNSTVMLMFLFESGMLGFVGGLVGLLLGVVFSLFVEFLGAWYFGSALLQASFPSYLLIGALLFSFGVGSFAGTLPAMQASKMHPVDALRYS